MARVGDTTPQPDPTAPVPPPLTTEVEPPAGATEEQVRAAAAELGLDYEHINADERDFLRVYVEGAEHLQSAPTDPITGEPILTPSEPAATEAASPDGATTGDAPVAGTADASSGGGEPPSGGEPGAPGAPVTTTPPEPITIEGLGDFSVEELTRLVSLARDVRPDEIDTLNRMRQGLATVAYIDPQTGQPTLPGGVPFPAAPQSAPVVDTGEEWVDPNAFAAVQDLRESMAQLDQQQRQLLEATLQQQQQAVINALQVGVDEFAVDKGLTADEIGNLTLALERANTLPAYIAQFAGDPTSGVKAALEGTYWSSEAFRQREIQRAIAEHGAATQSAEEKKAAAQGLVTPSGSTPRVPAAPRTRGEQDAAIVAMIEADLHGGNGSG